MSTSSKNSKSDEKIAIGYVSSVHGVKGEIRIVPLTDYPERFREMQSLNLYAGAVLVCTLQVRRVREQQGKGEFIIESGLSDRVEAEKLVGLTVMVEPEERVILPADRFWVDDLIGLQVQDGEGNLLGEVSDFLSFGGNEVYEVRDAEGGLHYIPAVKEFVREIDLDSGKIVVNLIEGLW